jgi:hypothetical protein
VLTKLTLIAEVLKIRTGDEWRIRLDDLTSVRPSRCLLILDRILLERLSLDELALYVNTLTLESEHPGYEACCGGCRKLYYRSKPADAVHYCLACGPVAGALEYE